MTQNRRDFIKTLMASSALTLSGFQWAQKADVIVIGAGLSGLYAAMLLEEQGYKVMVLEGNDRVGGRVYTLDKIEGKPEGGGSEIGDNYQHFIKVATQLGLTLEDPPPAPVSARDTLLHVQGKNILMKDWATDANNKLEEALKKQLPMLLESDFCQKNMPFKSIEDWAKPEFANLDISFAAFMKSKGLSDEAMRLIDANTNNNGVDVTSTLHVLRGIAMRTMSGNKKTMRVKGGNSRMPEAMAKAVKGEIFFGKAVTNITNTKKGVKITCADGSVFKARFAVCTLPFTVMRNIELDSETEQGFPHPIQVEAIDSLPYIAITQAHILPKKQFWKEDGMSPSMWTDTSIGRFFTAYNEQGEPNRFTCWLNGKEAMLLDKMPPTEAQTFLLKELKRIRPSTENALEIVHIHSWQQNMFAGGAYHQYAPAQVTKFLPYLNKPAGNIYFAGEHTNFRATGMEGAMESAARVVDEIRQKS